MARRSKKNKEIKENIDNSVDVKEQDTAENEDVENTSQESKEEVKPDFEAKFNEMNDKFLRLYSEFENFRRRTAKEKIDLLTTAKGESLDNLLPIVDDFERAMINNAETDDPTVLKEGFNLIHHKLLNTLQASGLRPMDTKKGDDFNTDIHEAITQIPAPTSELKGKVVDIIEKGYMINEKVVRYAKVVIGS